MSARRDWTHGSDTLRRAHHAPLRAWESPFPPPPRKRSPWLARAVFLALLAFGVGVLASCVGMVAT